MKNIMCYEGKIGTEGNRQSKHNIKGIRKEGKEQKNEEI